MNQQLPQEQQSDTQAKGQFQRALQLPQKRWPWSLSHTLFAYLIHWDSSRQSNYVSVHCYSVKWCSYCTPYINFASSHHG